MPPLSIVKENPAAPRGFFEAEAAGLRWLAAAGGARCVDVLAVGPGRIELVRVEERPATSAAARAFGAALAVTHAAGAEAFGAPPGGGDRGSDGDPDRGDDDDDDDDGRHEDDGHDDREDDGRRHDSTGDGPLFIGRRPMPAARDRTWGAFYARDRVRPFLAIAVDDGGLTVAQREVVERACDRIASGDLDDDEPPARLHGDLWNGNLLFDAGGAILIDPAAHGGHRETDLAMLDLFGAPFLDEILAGYDGAVPLRGGWRDRVPMHQLHPLAVHAASYGPSYGRALERAARATLELAGR